MSEELEVMEQNVAQSPAPNRIIQVFSDPGTLFENLRLYPTWLVPVLISILMAMVFSWVTRDVLFEFQKEAIYENQLIPEEVKDKAIEEMENKTEFRKNLEIFGGSIVNILLVYAVAAGAFFVFGNFILGGQASFKQVFSMYSWVGLIGALELLVRMPLVMAKGTMNVYTSLAVLMDVSQRKTVLFQLLNAFDVFTIWKIILWSMGMRIVYKFSSSKGYTATISLYLIYLVITIGLSQLF